MSNLLVAVFQEQGVFHITTPTTHPQLVGMIECAVQMVLSLLWCTYTVDRGRIAEWSIHFIDALPALNSRMVKVHGYTPAEILMGFNPWKKHYNLENTWLVTYKDFKLDEPLPSHIAQLHSILRNETWEWSVEAFAITNTAVKACEQDTFPS